MASQEIMLDIAEKFGFDSFNMVCECVYGIGGGVEWGGGCYSKWCNGATEHIFGFHSELQNF